jgi:hypothetical protein
MSRLYLSVARFGAASLLIMTMSVSVFAQSTAPVIESAPIAAPSTNATAPKTDPAPAPQPTPQGALPAPQRRGRPRVLGVARGLSLAADWERTPQGKRLPVQEIHVDDEGSFSLVVGKEAIALRMGRGPFRQAIDQAARVVTEAEGRKVLPAVVFLDTRSHPERVVVRLR